MTPSVAFNVWTGIEDENIFQEVAYLKPANADICFTLICRGLAYVDIIAPNTIRGETLR